MAIEGSLREFGVHDVLQLLDLARKTGELTIRPDHSSALVSVAFERGQIVGIRQSSPLRRLGQLLLRTGKLTEQELDRALALQREGTGRPLGWILLEQGSVTEAELRRQLNFQIEESVYESMKWVDGRFHFEEGKSPRGSEGPVEIRMRVDSLLMEGARRIDEWSRLESEIPSLGWVPVLVASEPLAGGPLDLRPGEWEVLARIDGERNLHELAAELGRSTFELARIVHGLIVAGLVQLEDRASMRNSIDPGRIDLVLREGRTLAALRRYGAAVDAFGRAIEIDPLSAEAHDLLAKALVRIGDLDRAIDAWEACLRLSPEPAHRAEVTRGLAAARKLRGVVSRLDDGAPGVN